VVKRAAKERLLELVDPALAALHKVLSDPDAEDAVKVRAALGILDRTGHRPGVVVSVEPNDRWANLLDDGAGPGQDDRSSIGGGEQGQIAAVHMAVDQAAHDATADAWRAYDDEDAEPYNGPSRIRLDENVVPGEVVEVARYNSGRSPAGNSDHGRHPLDWREGQAPTGGTEMEMGGDGKRLQTHEEMLLDRLTGESTPGTKRQRND
jgi:hypothetical protein